MKLLYINSTLGNGGMENFIVDIANSLVENHSITVISFDDLKESWLPPKRLDSRIKLKTLGTLNVLNPNLWIKLFIEIIALKPDIIHLNSAPSLVPFFLFSFLFRNIVFTFHSPPIVETDSGSKIFTYFFRKISRFYYKNNLIKSVVISRESYNQFIDLFGFKPNILIYNGIIPKKLSKYNLEVKKYYEEIRGNGFKKVFLAVGRYAPIKNFDMLVNVFSKFDELNQKIALVLILSTLDEDIETGKFKEHSPKNVFILGAKDNIIDYMYYADALCISSLAEGFSLVMVESLSVGLVILSTPVGGPLEFIRKQKNGFLSKDFDENSYEEIINQFINLNEDDIKKISQNNIKLFQQQLTMERCASEYLEYYKSILNQ